MKDYIKINKLNVRTGPFGYFVINFENHISIEKFIQIGIETKYNKI